MAAIPLERDIANADYEMGLPVIKSAAVG